MNKKGFTLVEILAVIVILAIIMIIAIPSIGNTLNAAKNKIGDIEKKNLKDASEALVLEIVNCDVSVSDYNYLFNKSATNCTTMQSATVGQTLETTIAKLKEKKHFNDTSNKCSGTIKITTDSNYKVSIDVNGVTCG